MSGKTAIIDPKFGSAGGYLVGRSHANNGIKAVVKTTGQPIEMQGGEVVITEPAVADKEKREFEGEMLTNRQILSRINESGGGVSFADGGEIPSEIITSGRSYKFGGKVTRDTDIVSSCGCKHYEKGGPIEITEANKLKKSYELHDAISYGTQTEQFAIEFCGIIFPVSASWVAHTLGRWRTDYYKLRFETQDGVTVLRYSGRLYDSWKIYDFGDEDFVQPQLVKIEPYAKDRIAKRVKDIDDEDRFYIGFADTAIDVSKEKIIELITTLDMTKYPLGYVDNGSQWTLYRTNTVEFAHGGEIEAEPKITFDDEFLPKLFAQGGIIPDTLTAAETQVVQTFKKNPRGHVSLFNMDLSDIPNLLSADLVHATGRTQSGNMDVFLTDKGEAIIRTMRFEDGGQVPDGTAGEAMVISGAPRKAYTYFKGTGHQYENPYQLNKAIEDLLDHNSNHDLNADEKQFLRYYSGYGGLEKFGAEGVGLLYEYFTPSIIAEKMWGLAYKHGYKGGPVMEPSCGIGEFFKYLPDKYTDATGCEINKYSARIANILFPTVNILVQSFEEIFIKNRDTIKDKTGGIKKYDLVIGNPPYGKMEGRFAGMGEKAFTKANNYVDYFISRGLDLLNPGGLLIYIIGVEVAAGGVPFLAQRLNPVKDKIIAKSDLIDAYRLPNGVFDRTDVLTDIIVLRKK